MKKIFDIKTGHYVNAVFEGEQESEQTQNQETQQQNQNDASTVSKGFKSVNTDEQILALEQQKQNLINDYQQRLKTQNNNLLATKQNISGNMNDYSNFAYDPVEVAADILNIENTIATLQKELADKKATIDQQIIQRKKALAAEVVAESLKTGAIPQKYSKYVLNESKLNQAKVYLDDLLFNEEYKPVIENLPDFKKVFSNSELLYGKDKEGYFVVCADHEDYKRLLSICKALGYEKEDIDLVITPQIFDKLKLAIF